MSRTRPQILEKSKNFVPLLFMLFCERVTAVQEPPERGGVNDRKNAM